MKILLIEDEKSLGESIFSYLKDMDYVCEWVKHYSGAEDKLAIYQYDCVLIDISLPGGSGLDFVEFLKQQKSKAGIIIISAKNSVDDKINGLDLGADDYLAKPFSLAELNSRIRSVIRRRNHDGEKEIVFHEISIIPDQQVVKVNTSPLVLTKKEYALLLFFVSNKNRVLTKEIIAEHLWGDNMDMADSYDFIYTHIKNLRKKLIDAGSADYVKTIYGMGYKFGDQ